MKIKSIILPIVAVFIAGCGGGINILPEPFTRERADGKIPVKTDLIRKQVRAELDGMPEGEAEVARWQAIEKDYNECRLSSARATKSEAEEVFAVCMSQRDYVYMYPVDAEQFHNDIFFAMRAKKEESERLAEERRIAAEKKAEEERIAAEKKAEEERIALEKWLKERRIAEKKKAEEERIAAEKRAEEKRLAAEKRAEEERKKIEQEKEEFRLLREKWQSNSNSKNKSVDKSDLFSAVESGKIKKIRELLLAGANPNAVRKPRSFSSEKETVLIIAVDKGYAEIVKMLLLAGANPNVVKNNSSLTALMLATWEGHAEVAEILLSAGANPNEVDSDGQTPLFLEILRIKRIKMKRRINIFGNIDMDRESPPSTKLVKLLIAAGADVNHRDDWDKTVLDYAKKEGYSEIVRILREAGAKE